MYFVHSIWVFMDHVYRDEVVGVFIAFVRRWIVMQPFMHDTYIHYI
jgi:hypothetical protein